MKTQTDDKFKYPTETSDSNADSIVIQIKSPSDHDRVSSDIEVKAKITSNEDVKNVKIYLDGNEVKSLDGNNKDIDFTMNSIPDGKHEIKVKATNNKDKSGDSTINVSVNQDWKD